MKRQSGSKRQALSAQRIALCALGLADQEGLEALSMRKIATKLGVEAMSLYYHVPSKEKLMAAMVEVLLADMPALSPGLGWRACLSEAATLWRNLALAHPGAFPLLATRAQSAEGLFGRFAAMLATLVEAGLSPTSGAAALSSFFFGLNGFLLAAAEPFVFRDVPERQSLPALADPATAILGEVTDTAWDLRDPASFERHLQFLLDGVAAAVQRA